jgi:hypothetical protein
MALVSTQPLTEMSTRKIPGGKGWLAHKADTLPTSMSRPSRKCGSLDVSQSHGPLRPVTGIAWPFLSRNPPGGTKKPKKKLSQDRLESSVFRSTRLEWYLYTNLFGMTCKTWYWLPQKQVYKTIIYTSTSNIRTNTKIFALLTIITNE